MKMKKELAKLLAFTLVLQMTGGTVSAADNGSSDNGVNVTFKIGAKPMPKKGLVYNSSAQELILTDTATETMLYSTDNVNWSEDVPKGINAGTYTVYYKEPEDTASGKVSVTVAKNDGKDFTAVTSDGKTSYSFGTVNTGITVSQGSGMYSFASSDESIAKADENGIITFTGTGNVTFTVKSHATDNFEEAVRTVTLTVVKGIQNAPENITAVGETVYGASDGKIAGIDSTMEYCPVSDDAENEVYTSVPDGVTSLTGLKPGSYNFRYKEKANYNPSDSVTVTVAAGEMMKAVLPEYAKNECTVTAFPSECEYGGSVTFAVEVKPGWGISEALTLETESGKKYILVKDGAAENKYTYTAENITDKKDITIKTVSGIEDKTAPVSEELEKNTEFLDKAEFTVTDNTAPVTVSADGEILEAVNGKYIIEADDKEHTVTVSDKAGNSTTYTVTVLKSETVYGKEKLKCSQDAAALIREDDSQKCRDIVIYGSSQILAREYDNEQSLTGNLKALNDMYYEVKDHLEKQRAYEVQLEADKKEFDAYRKENISDINGLAASGKEAEALVSAAVSEINTLEYNEKISLADNKGIVDGIVNKLKDELSKTVPAETTTDVTAIITEAEITKAETTNVTQPSVTTAVSNTVQSAVTEAETTNVIKPSVTTAVSNTVQPAVTKAETTNAVKPAETTVTNTAQPATTTVTSNVTKPVTPAPDTTVKPVPEKTEGKAATHTTSGRKPYWTLNGKNYEDSECTKEITNLVDWIIIPALGHSWESEAVVDREATCTEDGLKSIHCSGCDAVKNEEIIEAKGHSYGKWHITLMPSETSDGAKYRECEECGQVQNEITSYNKPEEERPSLPGTENDEQPDTEAGTVENITDPDKNDFGGDVVISKKELLSTFPLTQEEAELVENGSDIGISLSVEEKTDEIPSSEKDKAESLLSADEKIGAVIDVSIFKYIDGEYAGRVTELKKQLKVIIKLPDEIMNPDRTYFLVREHNGMYEKISLSNEAGNVFSFLSDKFSLYYIGYEDHHETHQFESAWTSDETGHWHAAECSHSLEKGEFAEHDFTEWEVTKEADTVNIVNGEKTRSCAVCGYTETEEFEPYIPFTYGDLDNDGKVTVYDMVSMMRYMREPDKCREELKPLELYYTEHAGDVYTDGNTCTEADLILLERHVLKDISAEYFGKPVSPYYVIDGRYYKDSEGKEKITDLEAWVYENIGYVPPESYVPKTVGDLNDDGILSAADLVLMIQCALSDVTDPALLKAGDLDDDGKSFTADDISLLKKLLSKYVYTGNSNTTVPEKPDDSEAVFMPGDINNDGKVSAADVIAMMQYCVKGREALRNMSENDIIRAERAGDLNDDGNTCTSVDIIMLRKMLIK